MLRKIKDCEIRQDVLKKRKLITREQYKKYCYLFFGEIGRQVLRGKIYKFEKKIGCLIIERVKRTESHITADGKVIKHRKRINFVETRRNKEELIIKGLAPYNKKKQLL